MQDSVNIMMIRKRRRATNTKMLMLSLITLLCLVSAISCKLAKQLGDIGTTIQNTTTQTTDALEHTITELQKSSSDWQQLLRDLESKLTTDAQQTIKNDVANVLARTIAQGGVEFRCDADFIRQRIIEDLRRIKAKVLHQPESPRQPAFCQAVPAVIDASLVPQDLNFLEFYGYNFDLTNHLQVFVADSNGITRNVTGSVDIPTPYAMTIAFGANGVQLNQHDTRFILEWNGTRLSSIAITQPQVKLPVCSTRDDPVFKEGDSTKLGPYAPPRVHGDSEFGGHGPAVDTSVTLKTSPQVIIASIFMDAKETHSDFTEVQGTQEFPIYKPPHDWEIDHINGPTASTFNYTDTNHKDDVFQMGPADLIREYFMVGDTSGDDVGRTSVMVTFNPILVTIRQVANCVPAGGIAKMMIEQISPTGPAISPRSCFAGCSAK
jgi:hypothetical protein